MDINVKELKEKLDNKEDFVLIDVREPYEHEEFNIGGQLIPVGSLPNKISTLEGHKNDEIVVSAARATAVEWRNSLCSSTASRMCATSWAVCWTGKKPTANNLFTFLPVRLLPPWSFLVLHFWPLL